MYKKIKNSSFMNLIWFIIAILPLLIVFIYSLSFLNKEEKTIIEYQEQQVTNLINYTNIDTSDESLYSGNVTNNNKILTLELLTAPTRVYYQNLEINKTYRLYYSMTNYIDNNGYIMIGTDTTFETMIEQIEIPNNYNINATYSYIEFEYTQTQNQYIAFTLSSNENENINLYLFLTDNLENNLTQEQLKAQNQLNYIIIEVPIEKTIYNSLNDYLLEINNSIQTNGFISNAFLNLAQLFGVTNVYYSLACYYIEYLLIIILLHLAFDLLYIVPNICHKFMEKIGGERD